MSLPAISTVFPIKEILHSISMRSALNIKNKTHPPNPMQKFIALMLHLQFLIQSLDLGLHLYIPLTVGSIQGHTAAIAYAHPLRIFFFKILLFQKFPIEN